MKKLFALACTVLLGAGMSLAQATSDGAGKPAPDTKKGGKKATSKDKVALNPQPEPPGVGQSKTVTPGEKVSLNPQPLPPKQATGGASAADKVSLNPQPLPPKQGKGGATSSASKVSLNPQPEPPGVQATSKQKTVNKDVKKDSVPASTSSPK
ncbi:MAG TPA: hypothetical protein VH724_03135 [Candidatus Angelobacter sp.]|nr:hypothetical protein [Candidatus Angelobacter sp.]